MTMKMLIMPFWAYCVQIFTTSLLSLMEAVLAVELHVLLDVDDGAVGAGDDGLAWRRR